MSDVSRRSTVVARLRAAGCVFAEEEANLLASSARTPADLAVMVDRRITGQPLEHVLGWAEFCGLRIVVGTGIFVPRRRTEFLVRLARDLADQGALIVDLCCGSGAVGAALAAAVTSAQLHAADIDPAAVSCARRNLASVGGRVYEGDLYQPLPGSLRGRVGVLVANAPYVPSDAIRLLPPEAREHEPRTALDGGSDGLDVVRRVSAGACAWLAPGGHLLVETSEAQAPEAARMFVRHGLVARIVRCDDVHATVVVGTRPADAMGSSGRLADVAGEVPLDGGAHGGDDGLPRG